MRLRPSRPAITSRIVLVASACLLSAGLQAQQSPPQSPPATRAGGTSQDADAAESAASKVPLDEIRRLVMIYNAVRQAYVDPVDDGRLMQAAVRGLLQDLDPHSAYLDKPAAADLADATRGGYDGIGVELQSLPDDTLRVIAPIDGTPAARADIKSGDIIIAIDGKPMEPDTQGDGPLRGAPGSTVRLTLKRQGRPKPFDVSLQRETIRIASVRGRMLEPGYGYVRVAAFQADTGEDFARTLDTLKKAGTLRGLVLDLRSNPGGLLTTAVQIADELLERGRIVSTRGRIRLSDAEFSATPGDRLGGAPLVVLVDAGSASASEVLAGALRDNGRARVVGSRTFGKGSVQTLLPLENGDSVKLTTARYYTPNGTSIQARGIQPDVVLHPEKTADLATSQFSEATLPRHLRSQGEAADGALVGEVLEGEAPIAAALAELKRMPAAGR